MLFQERIEEERLVGLERASELLSFLFFFSSRLVPGKLPCLGILALALGSLAVAVAELRVGRQFERALDAATGQHKKRGHRRGQQQASGNTQRLDHNNTPERQGI